MPVINLPRDTRGSELGTAIAGATKSLTDAYMQRETATGVADIMADPAIPENQKGVRALKDFGDQGYEFFKKFQQTQLMEAQAKNLLADAGLATVRTKLGDIQAQSAGRANEAEIAAKVAAAKHTDQQTTAGAALLPGQVAQQGATLGGTIAATKQTNQQTKESEALLPSKIETAREAPYAASAQTAKTQADTELINIKIKQAEQIINNNAQFFAGAGEEAFKRLLPGMGIDPNSADGRYAVTTAMLEPDPMKRGEAFSKAAGEALKRNAEIAKPAPLTGPQEERIVGAERQAASAEKFLTAFNKGGAQQTGWIPNAAPVKQFLTQIGVSAGDPAFVEMFNSTLQQVGDAARSGAQFYSSGVLKLAKETTPNIAGTPLHAVMAMNEIAARNIATLEAQRGTMLSNQPKAQLDATIKKWEGIAQKTAVDSYTIRPWNMQVTRADGSVTQEKVNTVDSTNPPPAGQAVFGKDGKLLGQVSGFVGPGGDPNTVVLYGGNQVDPKDLKNVLDARASFNIHGAHFNGAEIISIAKAKGVTPEDALAQLRAYKPGGMRDAPAARAPIR